MKNYTIKQCFLALFAIALLHTGLYATNTETNSEDCNGETAFAFLNEDDDPFNADDASTCFIPQFNRWGWTTHLNFSAESGQSSYELDIYAGAGQCDLSNGTDVGSVNVTYNDDDTITFDYVLEGYLLSEAHIYVGTEPYPTNNSGAETVAPGQYTFTDSDFGELENYSVTIPVVGTELYIIVHGVTKPGDCSDDEDSDDDDCDDSDGDGVCDADDICPGFDDTVDLDFDGVPDGCDDFVGGRVPQSSFDAYPIPFQNEVTIRYTFDYETFVKIELFDIKGVKLTEFKNIDYSQGTIGYSRLDLSQLRKQQLIFVRLTTAKGQFTKKLISSNSRSGNN